MSGCSNDHDPPASRLTPNPEPDWQPQREQMVRRQIEARDVTDEVVLTAMRKVPRHRFIPQEHRGSAYQDSPLPIGEGQTISQPYIVALMSELLQVNPGDKVLEIGTGSGYQAAVLGQMGVEVYTIEIVSSLCQRAAGVLEQLNYPNVHVRCGDGYGGWPEQAPFDGVIVTAAPERVPEPLLQQLKDGGRMVIPVGRFYQELRVLTRRGDQFEDHTVLAVRFVPMTGEVEQHD